MNKSPEKPTKQAAASDSRGLVRRALKGTLASVDRDNDYPYASLITLATDATGAPTFLISNLARHTANLAKDPRASILVDASGALADPLQGARVTLFGRAEKVAEEGVRRRFLARHPEAQFYADFPDFAFWRLHVEGAHYIGGFGRIFNLEPGELLVPLEGAESLVEAEPGIVTHMNEDHADALELYATVLAGGKPGAWRMTGIDPEGCDLLLGQEACRVAFAERITTPAAARKELVRLAAEARGAAKF